jgi:diguanylate cyclase (GGDEF)-like protein
MKRRRPTLRGQRAGRTSGPANVVDERTFSLVLQLELHKATRLRYCFSVLCVTPDLNGDMTPDVIRRLARVMVQHLRRTDLVTRLKAPGLAVLLIDAEPRSLEVIVRRVQDGLALQRITAKRLASEVTLSAGGACFPLTAQSSAEVISQAVDLMTRAQRDGGNQLYVPA